MILHIREVYPKKSSIRKAVVEFPLQHSGLRMGTAAAVALVACGQKKRKKKKAGATLPPASQPQFLPRTTPLMSPQGKTKFVLMVPGPLPLFCQKSPLL